MNEGRSRGNPSALMNRAFAAGAALCVGAVAVTGVFISKIAQSFAATHSAGSTSTGSPGSASNGGSGGVDDNGGFGNSTSQFGQQQNQQPLGGSNGS